MTAAVMEGGGSSSSTMNGKRGSASAQATDFCNAFWSQSSKRLQNAVGGGAFEEYGRDGYEALLGRMKTGTRTLEELRAVLKERAAMEEDYAKRLNKMNKSTKLGQGETGHMERAIQQLKAEIDQSAKSHLDLANLLRMQDATVADFANKRENGRKSAQTQVEKLWKAKKEQREYANKAKQKYEGDAVNINTMFAQLSITQGSEYDKIQANLDKRQQTLAVNERDYKNYVSVLRETTQSWNMQWKSFCDLCQDQEEERLEFVKARMWDWANALSTVAMAEDESAERTRTALEQCEPSRDLLIFVHNASTGHDIPDPPAFHDMRSAEPFKQTFKQARFMRSSTRGAAMKHSPSAVDDIAKVFHHASSTQQQQQHQAKRNNSIPAVDNQDALDSPNHPTLQSALPQSNSVNRQPSFSTGTPPSRFSVSPAANPRQAADRLAQSSTPNALRPANGAAPASLFQQQQQRRPSSTGPSLVSSNVAVPSGSEVSATSPSPARYTQPMQSSIQPTQREREEDDDDPILKALQQIQKSPAPASPITRARTPAGSQVGTGNRLSQPAMQQPHRPRSTSPAPVASMMQSPAPAQAPAVLSQYGQSFPGERATSRQGMVTSPSASVVSAAPPSQPHYSQGNLANLQSPTASQQQMASTGGFAGVGARGRSPSPQPYPHHHQHDAASSRPNSYAAPPASSYQPQQPQQPQQQQSQPFQRQPSQAAGIARPPSMNAMPPHQYVQSPSQSSFAPQGYPQAQHYQQQQPQYAPQQQQQQPQYGAGAMPRSDSVPAAMHHGRSPSVQTLSQQAPVQAGYPYSAQQPQQHALPQQQPIPQQGYGTPSVVSSVSAYSGASSVPPPVAQQHYQPQQPQQQQHAAPAIPNAANAPPTGQWTDDGKPILFYVSALYTYQAASNEEFSFGAGDVIAVTATDPDGWWTGQPVGVPGPGKLFPSNFTELLS